VAELEKNGRTQKTGTMVKNYGRADLRRIYIDIGAHRSQNTYPMRSYIDIYIYAGLL
jgi:hypothetical protein